MKQINHFESKLYSNMNWAFFRTHPKVQQLLFFSPNFITLELKYAVVFIKEIIDEL